MKVLNISQLEFSAPVFAFRNQFGFSADEHCKSNCCKAVMSSKGVEKMLFGVYPILFPKI
ncbi:hypothetical protein [Chlorobaculum parvum]|uniref:hypothetical protein n=1 Tax=Chlorobaculum parvum TaxID=274539 RepID=UPI0012EA2C4D|nr:hypothetical protein [Chlorobaculum parvum]